MRRGILQLFLAAVVLLQVVVASEKNSNGTSEAPNEKDNVKEEATRHVPFHVRPRGRNFGSQSSSQSKSSSKSHGSGTGKGYGYGSNGPQDKGPHGGRGGYHGPSYGPSYADESKGSGEEGSYRGSQDHRDASREYPSSYEDQYDNRGRYGPHYQSDESHGKGYASGQRENGGYGSSSGAYGKDSSLPSVSPDGYIESHSSKQSSENQARPQDLGPQGYDGPKESYGGQSYQGYHGGQRQGYGEYRNRDISPRFAGPATFGGFVPITNSGNVNPKVEPYSNVIAGKEIDGNKLSLFIKQLGQVPLSQVQGKNVYDSSEGKFGPGKEQQQGYILFPLVPKGEQGGNIQAQGYGGGQPFSGYNDGKNVYGVLKDAGYTAPASQQSGGYGPQQNNQGRDYVGASGNYGLAGHQQPGNQAYHQDKGSYGQSHEAIPNGKNVYGSNAGAYSNEGGYPQQQSGVYSNEGSYPKQQGGSYGGDSRYEPSVGGGHPNTANYGSSVRDGESYGVAGGQSGYDVGGKYGPPSTDGKTNSNGAQYGGNPGPAGQGYGYGVGNSGGNGYKTSAEGVGGGSYTNLGNLPITPQEYKGVVNFAGNLNSGGYGGGNVHAAPGDSQGQGKTNANYGYTGQSGDNLGYSQVGNQGPGKNYPLVGFIGGGDAKSGAYGDISSKGIEPSSQPIAPNNQKTKAMAIVLQKQPLNLPAFTPIEAFGPELGAQFKAPFKDYLGGGGFDFNLEGYGTGISSFDTGYKGRDTTSDLLHGFGSYGPGLGPVTYANGGKFY